MKEDFLKGLIKIKFSVGYNYSKREALIKAIMNYKEKISELYFSFGEYPNGRNVFTEHKFFSKWDITENQIKDLKFVSKMGIVCNLLLNANCYGKESLSRKFYLELGDTVDYLINVCRLSCITTTSPIIAKFIKNNFSEIEVRASVNMGIENTDGMDYVAEYFDSYYLKREYNRNLKKLLEAREWCNASGKKLYGLANSGCLNFCSAHTFHDNLVAHEKEIAFMDNAYDFEGQCYTYLKNDLKKREWFRITNFIRPEDVKMYDGIFDGIKLATRVNRNPAKIIESYMEGSYSGALTELLEPDHSGMFYPVIIENKKIPNNFADKTLNCDKNCKTCGYCNSAFDNSLVYLDKIIASE